MTATAMDARRKLHSLARNGGNWRLKGLYLAELPKTEFTPKTLADAWPKNQTDYRFLQDDHRDHQYYAPDRTLQFAENEEGYRRLSDATKNSDWSDAGEGMQEIHADKAIKRALAYGDTSEEFDTLWREQLMDTVIEGSRKNQIARDAAQVTNVETNSGSHPRGPDDRFASAVAEGEAISDDRGNHDTVDWDTTKFAEGARATKELIDHSLVDEIEFQIEWLGRQCENSLNRVWLNELIDNAASANDVDTSAENNRALASMNAGMTNVELEDFEANAIAMHPRYAKVLFDNDVILQANTSGSDNAIRERTTFPLFGLEGYRGSNGVYDGGSNTWDFSASGETGAVVYNQDLMAIHLYSDIQVENYTDPVRDLEGVNARINVDANYKQPASAARLQY